MKDTTGGAVHKKRGSEDNLSLIELRDKHLTEKTPSNIHDVSVLKFRNPVLLRGVWARKLREDTKVSEMIREGMRQILPRVVRAKRFNGHTKLSLNHTQEILTTG